jgi:hypothetical protein
MRTSLALICSLALACAASGQVTSTGGGGGGVPAGGEQKPKGETKGSGKNFVLDFDFPSTPSPRNLTTKAKPVKTSKQITSGDHLRLPQTTSLDGQAVRGGPQPEAAEWLRVQVCSVGNPPENFKKGSVPIGNPAAVLPGGSPAETAKDQGKLAGGKKKGEKVSPTPRPR